ncbi:MAG: hypothetical protein M1819_006368 [Sarea resinae]|nr:MAG: hypothetical protein M1819_006368 [Sarea resinae]
MSALSSQTTISPSSSSSGSNKAAKQSKIIALKLPPAILARFPSKQDARKASKSKSESSSTSTPIPNITSPPPADNTSESNSTPAPNPIPGENAPASTPDGPKRKGIPGPKPGSKRASGLGPDGLPKPRGKPGPKKKLKLENGATDASDAGIKAKGAIGAAAAAAGHKLGPKANQGAINAGLRALDRTGKPCRKWTRKGFQVKSFTGVMWELSSWRTPKGGSIEPNGDGTSDSLLPGESDSKADAVSSALTSEKSNSGGDVEMAGTVSNAPSSPITGIATPA